MNRAETITRMALIYMLANCDDVNESFQDAASDDAEFPPPIDFAGVLQAPIAEEEIQAILDDEEKPNTKGRNTKLGDSALQDTSAHRPNLGLGYKALDIK